MIKQACDEILSKTDNSSKKVTSSGWYVTLYKTIPFYGGPEEGGWWGSDTVVEASTWYPTEEKAEMALEAINIAAELLIQEAKKRYGEQCLRETQLLEEQGLDDSDIREVDGEKGYFAVVEDSQGAEIEQGCRHYE